MEREEKMSDALYLNGSIASIIFVVVIYALKMIQLKCEDMVILQNGTTLRDIIYFNAECWINFFFSVCCVSMCYLLSNIYDKKLSLVIFRYCILFISFVLIIRCLFNMLHSNGIVNAEWVSDSTALILTTLRAIYKIKAIKISIKNAHITSGSIEHRRGHSGN